MARRKDHSPDELKALIQGAAQKLISNKGLNGLTARAIASAVGYAPGTIYNIYKDMDDLIADINFMTLGRLYAHCQLKLSDTPSDFSRIRKLAYAYIDFAHDNRRAWETLFAANSQGVTKTRLTPAYQQLLQDMFNLIENTLHECLGISDTDAATSARTLWSCLHGITILTLDGRLKLLGIDEPHVMIDDLLRRYLTALKSFKN